MSADEYVEAASSDSLDLTHLIILVGGWAPVGIVAIVAGIVVAFLPEDRRLFLLIALGGTILGYLAAIGATLIFDVLDIR